MDRLATAEYDSPLGKLRVAATPKGVVRIALPRAGGRGFAGWLGRALPGAERLDWLPPLDKVRQELDQYFARQLRSFAVPVDLRGTSFQLDVWEALRAIAYGDTASYGELARFIRRPQAARAVGAASGANPLPILVPCHRVVAAGGKLGGYSGGLEIKRKLLALEQAALPGGLR
ncbi:MAG: methylated-DNA--[protein]-cysteine S-methyltransferase [Myxococcota bacterium]